MPPPVRTSKTAPKKQREHRRTASNPGLRHPVYPQHQQRSQNREHRRTGSNPGTATPRPETVPDDAPKTGNVWHLSSLVKNVAVSVQTLKCTDANSLFLLLSHLRFSHISSRLPQHSPYPTPSTPARANPYAPRFEPAVSWGRIGTNSGDIHLSPEGTFENSPAIHRWDSCRAVKRPLRGNEARLRIRSPSGQSVPVAGTWWLYTWWVLPKYVRPFRRSPPGPMDRGDSASMAMARV